MRCRMGEFLIANDPNRPNKKNAEKILASAGLGIKYANVFLRQSLRATKRQREKHWKWRSNMRPLHVTIFPHSGSAIFGQRFIAKEGDNNFPIIRFEGLPVEK